MHSYNCSGTWPISRNLHKSLETKDSVDHFSQKRTSKSLWAEAMAVEIDGREVANKRPRQAKESEKTQTVFQAGSTVKPLPCSTN